MSATKAIRSLKLIIIIITIIRKA